MKPPAKNGRWSKGTGVDPSGRTAEQDRRGGRPGGENMSSSTKNGRWAKGTSGSPFGRPVGSRHKADLSPEDILNRASEEVFRGCLQIAKATKNRALLRRLERMTEMMLSMSLRRIAGMGDDQLGVLCALGSKLGRKAPGTMSFKEIKQ